MNVDEIGSAFPDERRGSLEISLETAKERLEPALAEHKIGDAVLLELIVGHSRVGGGDLEPDSGGGAQAFEHAGHPVSRAAGRAPGPVMDRGHRIVCEPQNSHGQLRTVSAVSLEIHAPTHSSIG